MKILLVDDSRTMRTIQKSVLVELGYSDIAEATDGQDALNQLRTLRPDLLIVDWSMPNLDGMGLVRAFRQTNTTTPIIMVASEAERPRVIEATGAGVNSYVVKPFTPDLLSQRIQETLAQCAAA